MGERVGARWAHEVICVSEHHSAELERRYERPVHCLPNGAPSPRILPPGPLLRSLGLEGDDYVLFVGRLVPDKRVEDLAAAAAHLPAAVRVLVVGDAADTDEYASNLRRDSGDRVTFAGFRTGDDLAEVYSNARLFVLPSAVEGLSVSLLEALAYGIPCIASDIPANRQVLSGGEVGRLVPVGDVAGLRDEIAALWGDEAERARLSRLGKEHAARDYDWDAIAGETLRIVRSACDTGSAKA
jgi:glycosyltransferase involved in cell wall biosynthesis